MGVAAHLKIDLADYDQRIRTFIPGYEEMIDAAAGTLRLLQQQAPIVVDLGIGTGALADRCFRVRPRARLVGIDGDADIVAAAGRRLKRHARRLTLVCGDFERTALPTADAMVASLSLHHVPTRARKRRLYARIGEKLRKNGLLVTADCAPAGDARTAAAQLAAWRTHMLESYDRADTDRYFRAWARDDVYMPMSTECELMREAGMAPEVVWRRGAFAVIAARRK